MQQKRPRECHLGTWEADYVKIFLDDRLVETVEGYHLPGRLVKADGSVEADGTYYEVDDFSKMFGGVWYAR